MRCWKHCCTRTKHRYILTRAVDKSETRSTNLPALTVPGQMRNLDSADFLTIGERKCPKLDEVIIPVRNGGQALINSVKSVLSGSNSGQVLLTLSDNFSTDGTPWKKELQKLPRGVRGELSRRHNHLAVWSTGDGPFRRLGDSG